MSKVSWSRWSVAFGSLGILGCSGQPSGGIEPFEEVAATEQALGDDAREEAINEIVYGTLDLVATPEEQEAIGDFEGYEYRNTGTYRCTYREINEVDNTSEIVAYSPNAGVLCPGAILQGDSIQSGILEQVPLARTGGRISVEDMVVVGTPNYRDLTQHSCGSVTSAVASVLQNATSTSTVASFDYLRKDIRQLEETLLELGVDAEWAKTKLSLNVTSAQSSQKTDMFVLFRQKFFTVAVQNWFGPNKAKAFDPSHTPEEVAMVMSPRNPPAYVRNVSYGRMMIMRLTTNESESSLTAALDATFKKSGGTFSASLTAAQRQTLSNSTFYVAAVGGDPGLALSVASSGPTELPNYLNSGAQVSYQNFGAPLSYTVAHLATDNVISISNASRYTVPSCTLATDRIRVKLESIKAITDSDTIGKGDFKYGIDVYKDGESPSVGLSGLVKLGKNDSHSTNVADDVEMSKLNQSCFHARIRAPEYNDSGSREDHNVEFTADFCYQSGREIWEETTGGVSRDQWDKDLRIKRVKVGRAEVEFRYRVTRVHDCPSGLRSDGTLCVDPSSFAVNQKTSNVIDVCEGNPITIDARTLYATSSHVQSDGDRFFVEAAETDSSGATWVNGVQHWIFMGSEPNWVVDRTIQLGALMGTGGHALRANQTYRLKLASFPWRETVKLVRVNPLRSDFKLNESTSNSLTVGPTGSIVLDGSTSCTSSRNYTLRIQGPNGTVSKVLTDLQARTIHNFDIRNFASENGFALIPGNTYSIQLQVSGGASSSKSVTIAACDPGTAFNGRECVHVLSSSVWDADDSRCVTTPSSTVSSQDCSSVSPRFTLLPYGDNIVRLQSQTSGQCLGVGTLNGSPVLQRVCDFDTRSQFAVVTLGGGVIQLKNRLSNECLSIQPNGVPLMTSCANSAPTRLQFDWYRGIVAAPAPIVTATAQSTFPGYSAAKIVDGNRSTALGDATSWANAHQYAPNGILPQWVDIDFGEAKSFSTVDVYTTQGFPIADYDLLRWDGANWQLVRAVVGNTQALRSETFPQVTTQKLRILARKGPSNQPSYARLNEVEVR